VVLLQKNGEISQSSLNVAYEPCNAGRFSVGTDCQPCALGSYANTRGQSVCSLCVPGFHAPTTVSHTG
jgi:hypothetical protein